MSAIPLTRVAAFRPFPDFLGENGCDVARHLMGFGVDPESLFSPEALLPLPVAGEFVEEIGRREGIENFGLEVGSRARLFELGFYGQILSQSLTLKDLLQKAILHLPRVNSGASAWLEGSPVDKESVRFGVRERMKSARAIVDGYGLLLFLEAVRLAAGPEWRPRRVALCAEGGDVSRFEALSDAQVDRQVDHAGFDIPRRLLSRPVCLHGREGADCAATIEALEAGGPPGDLVGSISQTLRAGFGTRVPTISQVAEMACLSVSTLKRRLAGEQLSFRGLVERVRFEEARKFLNQKGISLQEIAHHLGYSDSANFAHAFRRWTGTSPSEYRRQLKKENGNS